ncbi:MAG: tRNA lysidine(34) synthetase TilS [Proteobacteria bacterium]|nr:tRNA lysidine(34) synthetase TilS [Pseudomonadota bacterium]MBU1640752.1 tRNA lysidine(34) synthetase TilS [Pseudomonadota bacterium]
MHPLEKKILQLLTDNKLLIDREAVLVGVSAGTDSMALFHLLAGFGKALPLKVTAVYVDHGLRPSETEAEANLVQEAAVRLAAGFALVRVDVRGEAARQKKSLEHMARDLRYQAFDQVAAQVGAGKIAVAHTADDQAEEIIIRMLRGAGRGGFSGMRMIRANRIIRPLLTTPKEEILVYLQDRNIPFLEDSSNQDLRFLRNQVRLEVLPFLERYNPAVRETLRRSAAILQDEEDLLAEESARCWHELALVDKGSVDGGPEVTIMTGKLMELHPALQRRVAERMLLTMEARPDSRQIEHFISLAREGQGNAQLHFSGGLRIRKHKGQLICSYPQGKGAGRGDLS